MSDQLKVRFKIGEIEFEAEGSAEDVESQRKAFMTDLLPEAVNAVIRTSSTGKTMSINTVDPILLASQNEELSNDSLLDSNYASIDMSRESLASFCNSFGSLNDQDFVLVAAYFDEKKNKAASFSRESIHKYYQEARRPEYSNLTVLINSMVGKGLIMDTTKVEGSSLLQYVLCAKGLERVEKKDFSSVKTEKKSTRKAKKPTATNQSTYSNLCLDELNLKNYPEINKLKTYRERMIMIMYIVTNEGKGDQFSIADVGFLMTDLWGIHSTTKHVSKIFSENKTWFKIDKQNNTTVKRKLLEGGKDFARKLIEEYNSTIAK